MTSSVQGDRGDIVLGWLTKLTVVLGLLGLVGFDLISLGIGRLSAEDTAQQAARAAVETWGQSKNVQSSYEAALGTLNDPAADTIDPASFSVTPDGTVTLTVEHVSTTLVVEKVGPIRPWTRTSATVTGRPST